MLTSEEEGGGKRGEQLSDKKQKIKEPYTDISVRRVRVNYKSGLEGLWWHQMKACQQCIQCSIFHIVSPFLYIYK